MTALLTHLRHAMRVHASEKHEAAKKKERPAAVTEAQHHYVKAHPACEACGCNVHVQGHHVVGYRDSAELAADPSNFISLCMGPSECHLLIGHGDDFHFNNPNVRADAAAALAHPEQLEAIRVRAKAARKP